jgi:hypothetical protein
MDAAATYRAAIQQPAPRVDARGLGGTATKCLDRLEGPVERGELALDHELVVAEVGFVLPRPLLHSDNVEPSEREFLGQHATRSTVPTMTTSTMPS